jgi:hypothetical protein
VAPPTPVVKKVLPFDPLLLSSDDEDVDDGPGMVDGIEPEPHVSDQVWRTKWATKSYKPCPGTLADLLPYLDEYFHGDEQRRAMRDQEEVGFGWRFEGLVWDSV